MLCDDFHSTDRGREVVIGIHQTGRGGDNAMPVIVSIITEGDIEAIFGGSNGYADCVALIPHHCQLHSK